MTSHVNNISSSRPTSPSSTPETQSLPTRSFFSKIAKVALVGVALAGTAYLAYQNREAIQNLGSLVYSRFFPTRSVPVSDDIEGVERVFKQAKKLAIAKAEKLEAFYTRSDILFNELKIAKAEKLEACYTRSDILFDQAKIEALHKNTNHVGPWFATPTSPSPSNSEYRLNGGKLIVLGAPTLHFLHSIVRRG